MKLQGTCPPSSAALWPRKGIQLGHVKAARLVTQRQPTAHRMRAGEVDLGMTDVPCCSAQRTSTWPTFLPVRSATAWGGGGGMAGEQGDGSKGCLLSVPCFQCGLEAGPKRRAGTV